MLRNHFAATVRLHPDVHLATVSPRIYGHFAEHLGRCCYDGLWVGAGHKEIEHVEGFRTDVVEALRKMPVPFLRWPGGCYADHYHWRDGIGEQRTRRLGMSCGLTVEDDNSLGTHEFLRFCELIGAEPYLAGNVGSGTVQEMCDWVEYVNTDRDTALARERRANGRPFTWNVRVWGVGNESWGCGGEFDPEPYAQEYRKFASMLRHQDSSLELVAVGHTTEWNERVIKALKNHLQLVSHFSIHRYWVNGGGGTTFGEEEFYDLLTEAEETEAFIVETHKMLEAANPDQRPVGIALDEWGVWHPEARSWGPDAAGTPSNNYEQAGTMRDALAAAVAFEGFHRQAKHLSMANLAQIVNVLHAPVMTADHGIWVTPTYHLLSMHKHHIGATTIGMDVRSDRIDAEKLDAVGATATTNEGGLTVTLTNRRRTEAAHVQIETGTKGFVEATTLHAIANAENSIDHGDLVVPRPLATEWTDHGLTVTLPPCSVTTIRLTNA